MKTKIKILLVSFVLAAAVFTGINIAENSNTMDVTLTDISSMALALGEQGGCCTAYSTDEHCGMKSSTDDSGFCCKSSDTACDKCTMSDYRECS